MATEHDHMLGNKEVNALKSPGDDDHDGDANDETFDSRCLPQLKRVSFPTWLMLVTEFCERTSYYGIKAGLVLYFTQGLRMSSVTGKAWYHAFGMTSYFTGVLGAIMADSWLGKYKTILYTLIAYSLAEILLTFTSIPSIGQGKSVGPLFSLILMAAACGNVKPCLGAFGGDQVNRKDVDLIKTFFSMFYASVNVGATLAMIFAPMLRTDVQCYGRDCYPAVFGVNTVMIILALVSFVAGRNGYVKRKPQGNMVVQVVRIIYRALRQKRRSSEAKEHWLYYADDHYKRNDISDVQALLKVLKLFIPLPVFWALFHQQGSSWTLQAEQMNGQIGSTEIRSDQIQFLNPVLVLILIPLYDIVIYPTLEKCGIKLSSLKRMVGGMLLAALSFFITALVQMKIQDVAPTPLNSLSPGSLAVDFINMSPCESVGLKSLSLNLQVKYGEHTGYRKFLAPNSTITLTGRNCYSKNDSYSTIITSLNLNSSSNYQSILLDIKNGDLMYTAIEQLFPSLNMKKSDSRIRTLYSSGGNTSSELRLTYKHLLYDQKSMRIGNFRKYDGKVRFLQSAKYSVELEKSDGSQIYIKSEDLSLLTFGEYTLALTRPQHTRHSTYLVGHIFEDVPGTSVHRLVQILQYTAITAGEIMFSVTGLEFSYSQAPQSMKSVLQSFWMLSVAFGDLVVVLISVINPVEGVVGEMFLYGGLMVVIAVIFGVMCMFYTYNDFSGRYQPTEDVESKNEENGVEILLQPNPNGVGEEPKTVL